MKDDPIVEEIRKIRHSHAEKFNNDVAAIFEDYRRIGMESGRQYVSYPPRRIEPLTKGIAAEAETQAECETSEGFFQ